MAPIIPHSSEYVWKLLGKTGSVRTTSWPTAGPIDEVSIQMKDYLFNTVHDFRIKKDLYTKPKKGEPKVANKATIFVAQNYPDWQQKVLTLIKPFFPTDSQGTVDDKALVACNQENNEESNVFCSDG